MKMTTFRRLSDLVYRHSGIVLPEEKLPLLVNRLGKRMRALGLKDEREYLEIVEVEQDPDELIAFIDVISTNTTKFFREPEHFEVLHDLLTQKAKTAEEIRLWCAASSSGEEPYTLAMTVAETPSVQKSQFRMLATDICMKVLREASNGRYSEKRIQDVPSGFLRKYFSHEKINGDKFYRVSPELREMILFKKFNLSSFPYPLKGPFQFIFCRNVMIYFDVSLRQKIIDAFYEVLAPGGYLFIGHSENLLGIKHNLKTLKASIFYKK